MSENNSDLLWHVDGARSLRRWVGWVGVAGVLQKSLEVAWERPIAVFLWLGVLWGGSLGTERLKVHDPIQNFL